MEHLEPRINHRIHRYTLQSMRQDKGDESLDILLLRSRTLELNASGNEELEDYLIN